MKISTRGRYALRVMDDLSRHGDGGFTSLGEISERQDISRKYLEGIMSSLSKAGLVESVKGKNGGYRLARAPRDYTVGEILRLTEGDLHPVVCQEDGKACARAKTCPALPVWDRLNAVINDYLDSVSLEDLRS